MRLRPPSGRSGLARAALLAVLLGAVPAGLAARTVQDVGADGPPRAAVTADSAAELRGSLERPPSGPPFDALDAVALPFRAIALPVELTGKAVGAGVDLLTRPGPPPFYLWAYRSLSRWGLELGAESLGTRSGPAGSAELVRFEPLYLRTAWSIRGYHDHAAGLRWSGDRGRLEVGGGFHRDAEPRFWGLGPRTPQADRTSFRRDRLSAELSARVRLAGPLTAGVAAGWERNEVGPGSDGDSPDLLQLFDRDSLFGADGRTRFLRVGPRLELDLTRRVGFQTRGLTAGAAADLYGGVGSTSADFHRVGGWVEVYLPANPRQTLAVRAEAEANRRDAGRGVPFTHMPTLGDAPGGRGYADGRFRAPDLLALSAEWRWEVWRELQGRMRLEGFVFFEEGTTVADLGRVTGSDLRPSWGGGLRLAEPGGLMGRAYLAGGEEGVRAQAELSAEF